MSGGFREGSETQASRLTPLVLTILLDLSRSLTSYHPRILLEPLIKKVAGFETLEMPLQKMCQPSVSLFLNEMHPSENLGLLER